MTLATLLDALADGPRTETALADRLDVDAETVRAWIGALREAGFEIDRDGGYRVADVPEYGLGVQYGLDASFRIEFHESIGSTNDRGRELAEAGERDVVVLADRQTGGRGREGRSWSSPPGGIYLSIVLRPDLPPARTGLLTLAAAVATAEAVRAVGVEPVIKWPNDVLLAGDGRKLSGILTESATAGGAVEWAVVGIGVNANVDPAALPDGSTSLLEHIGRVRRRDVVQPLLEAFDSRRADPERIRTDWRRHASTPGQRVRIETSGGAVVGRAIDIDDDGGLRVATDGGETVVAAGDCEHLRPA